MEPSISLKDITLEDLGLHGGEASVYKWKVNEEPREKPTLLKIYKDSTTDSKLLVRLETIKRLRQLLESDSAFAKPFSRHFLSFPHRLVQNQGKFIGFEMIDGNRIPNGQISSRLQDPRMISADAFTAHTQDLELVGLKPMKPNEIQGFALRIIMVSAWLHHEGLLMPDFSSNNVLMYRTGKSIWPYFIDVDSFLPLDRINDQEALDAIGETPNWSNANESSPSMERDVWKVGLLFRRFTGAGKNRVKNIPYMSRDKEAMIQAFDNEVIGSSIWRMASKDAPDRPTFQEVLRRFPEAGVDTEGFEEYFDLFNPQCQK
jgi:hypothetical protein